MRARACVRAYLLEAGHREHELDVQLAVVLGQRLVSVVADQLHHRAEGQRLRETVLPVSVVDPYQFIIPPFPVSHTHGAELQVKRLFPLVPEPGCWRT